MVLPCIRNSVLHPVAAITGMFSKISALPSDIAFACWELGRYVPVVAYKVRLVLAKYIRQLGLDPSQLTFHAFCRSRAMYSFNHNVPFEDIRLHGSWKRDAIYAYCKPPLLLIR